MRAIHCTVLEASPVPLKTRAPFVVSAVAAIVQVRLPVFQVLTDGVPTNAVDAAVAPREIAPSTRHAI